MREQDDVATPSVALPAGKPHFSRFLEAQPGRLHFAAHSHHPWPDVSFEAQKRAWLDAARWMDAKWGPIFEAVLPAAQRHVARLLSLPDPGALAFAPNTHELFKRIVSSRGPRPRILSTDGEFHSFERQTRRWEEADRAVVERVAAEPFATLPDRLRDAALREAPDVLYVSHVLFSSGWIFPELATWIRSLPADVVVVVDGYHAFAAMPVDGGALSDRAFYLGGGYKYAMSGEGVCFAHCPPGVDERPVDTGWYAGFGALETGVRDVGYAPDGGRFLGSTFDPVGLYRLNAVMDLWEREGVDPAGIHAHARRLQERLLDRLDAMPGPLGRGLLVPDASHADRGNFLTFRTDDAGRWTERLAEQHVVVDHRGDRLRLGFGWYQDDADVDELAGRLRDLGA